MWVYMCIYIYIDIRADKLLKNMLLPVHIYIHIHTHADTRNNPVVQLPGHINADSVVMAGCEGQQKLKGPEI